MSPKRWRTRRRVVLTWVTLLAIASTAQARTDQLNLTNETEQVGSGASAFLLDLQDGRTSAQIFVAERSWVVLSFSAECSVAADDGVTWLDIDILLDGVALPPTDSDNAFCTSTGNGTTSGRWFSASADAAIELDPGVYEVEVEARLATNDAADAWRIGERALLILVAESPGPGL